MEVRTLWADIIACLQYIHKNEIIEIEEFRFVNFIDDATKISLPEFIKSRDAHKRDEILEKLIAKYDIKSKLNKIPSEVWELMNKEDLQKLASSNVLILVHTDIFITIWGMISLEDANKDISISKRLLEDTIEKQIDMIAYPDGNYSVEVKEIADKIWFR